MKSRWVAWFGFGVLGLVACGGQNNDVSRVESPPGALPEGGVGSTLGSDGGAGSEAGSAKPRLEVTDLYLGIDCDPATGCALANSQGAGPADAFDTLLGVPCAPRPASDGTTRCVPVTYETVLFTDSVCTNAVVPLSDTPCSRRYATEYYVVAPEQPGMFVIGDEAPMASEFYEHINGTCAKSSGWDASQKFTLHAAQPASPSEWVELHEDIIPITQRLEKVDWVADDGSRVPESIRLVDGGADCWGETRCIPAAVARDDGVFADANCSVKVAGAKTTPVLIENGTDAATTYDAVGDEVTVVYINAPDSSCVSVPLSWGLGTHYYRHGAPVSPDTFPPLAATPSGSGRVRALAATSEGAELRREIGRGYDAVARAICSPTLLSDGTTRCITSDVQGSGYFSDSSCTRVIDVYDVQVNGPLQGIIPPPKWLGRVDWTSCNGLRTFGGTRGPTTVFNVAPIDHATPVYWNLEGACQAYSLLPVVPVYGATTPIDPSIFPSMPPDLVGAP